MRLALRCRRTRDREPVRCRLPRQLPPGARPRGLLECPQMRPDQPLARTRDGGRPHSHGGGTRVSAQPVRRFEQKARTRECARAWLATTEQVCSGGAFFGP